ncbi:GAF domain-containing sensor histidine kinase, partial [Aduncisulcus paluster]
MIRAKSEVQDELESMNQNLEELVEERTLALQKQIEDSKTLQEKLIQKEKMAIVGELVPGFAHDINTPVGVAVTANSFVKRKISKVKDQIESGSLKKSAIEMCLSELEESTNIIEKNLQ